MSKITLAIISFFLAYKAYAVDFTSPSSSFYPCNAGLAQRVKKSCFIDKQVVDTCENQSDCSCIYTSKGDDYFSARSRDWTLALSENYNLNSERFENLCDNSNNCSDKNYLGEVSNKSFSRLTEKSGTKIIDELSFILGSDLLGADYFVDICFKREKDDEESYRVIAKANPLGQASSYLENTKLKTKYIVQCKNSPKKSWEFKHSPRAINFQINPNNKFCIIRFRFKERTDGSLRTNHLTNAPFNLKVDVQ